MFELHWNLQLRLVAAVAMGLLVGLEREHGRKPDQGLAFGGVRTFPLVSLFGFGCAWLFGRGVAWAVPAGLIACAMLSVVSYVAKIRGGRFGVTTEMSALLMFVTGATACLADVWLALALGVINAFLLSEKDDLEGYVRRLDKAEVLAAIKFLLVALIILPVLPDRGYTRFDLNPLRIWRVVVLVSSVGYAGYLLSRKLGDRVGLWLSGLLGGVASSTAVAVAMGRLGGREPARAGQALQAALLASGTMYLRLWVLASLLNPAMTPALAWRLASLSALAVLLSFGRGRTRGSPASGGAPVMPLANPYEIRPALAFAALFTVLRVVIAVVRERFGVGGLAGLSLVVGVVDVDPFILSLLRDPAMIAQLVVRGVLLACMSNTLAKGVYFAVLAPHGRRQAAWRYAALAAAHVPLLWRWPGLP